MTDEKIHDLEQANRMARDLLRQALQRAETAEAEAKRLRAMLASVLDRLPQDTISRTFWDDDDGTIVYHKWYLDARAALAAPAGEVKLEEANL